MAQKRIRELGSYTQLSPGDYGYIPPSNIYIVFDSIDFGTEPLKYSAEDILSTLNYEKGRLTGLASADVSVTFGNSFSGVPITVLFKVYRYFEVSDDEWIKEDVKYYLSGSTWLTSTGFDITIDSSESLTGVIIEYKFEEA